MPTPFERYKALSDEAQKRLHVQLAQRVEGFWLAHVEAEKMDTYIETVVGSEQTIDRKLPADAIEAVRRGVDHADVAKRYREPISALQDDDVCFGKRGEFAYYAIYNLFGFYFGHQKDDWLIVNQALSSFVDMDDAVSVLCAILSDLESE